MNSRLLWDSPRKPLHQSIFINQRAIKWPAWHRKPSWMLQRRALAFLHLTPGTCSGWKIRPNPRRQLKGENEAGRKNKYTPHAYDLLNSILYCPPFAFTYKMLKNWSPSTQKELHKWEKFWWRSRGEDMQKVVLIPLLFTKFKKKIVLTWILQFSLLVCCAPFRLFLGKNTKPYEGSTLSTGK